MSSPLPSNMALCTVRGRYGTWATVEGQTNPQFTPYVGMKITFTPAYPFVTNTAATPSPVVIATAPRTFTTDSDGYMSDPFAGNTRNCQIVASDDPDISPTGWKYLVTFSGPGATNFRAFRTPAPSGAVVDMAIITPQRVASGSTPTSAEIAAANAAASAAAAEAAVASINRGQAGGVAPLDADGDVNDAFGVKVLPGGGGGGGGQTTTDLITDMSPLARLFNKDTTQAAMRSRIGAGTGNGTSNLVLGTIAGTAADAAAVASQVATRAADSTVVHRTAVDESIQGIKVFSSPPQGPPALGATDLLPKGQFDASVTSLTTAINARILTSARSQAGGVAGLNANGNVIDASGNELASVTPNWETIDGKPNVAVLDINSQLPLTNLSPYVVIRIGNGGSTVPVRPAYNGSVEFYCSIEPPRTGSVAGGTAAMAPGDVWLATAL
jgi:hypothetical protein